jgi:hypothetical protein
MSDTYLVQTTGQPGIQPGGADCATLVRLATLGAVVGGSLAAATNLQRVQSGEVTAAAAVGETGKAAVTAAVATAIGGAAASGIAEQGLLRLGVMFAAGTLALYGLQRWADARTDADE